VALRDFLYLDRSLVRGFLAQAEQGVVDEATERQTTSGKAGIGGRLGAGLASVSAEKSKERSLETEAIVRQVAASEFDRLYTILEEQQLVILEEVSEISMVSEIRRKQFLEVDARIRTSGLHQALDLFSAFTTLAPMMKQFGTDITINESAMSGMQALSSLAGADRSLPVIASVPGSAHFKVGLELNPANSLTGAWDVDASVLLKVQRVIRKGERYLVGDPLGGLLKLVPERDRAKLFRSLSTPEARRLGISEDIQIHAPAVVGTPIAIYR
jgi:hypothetical protein